MDKIKLISTVIVLFSVLAAGLSLFFPTPDYLESILFKIPFMSIVFSTTLYLCCAAFLSFGLKGFRVGLKVSYAFICVGVTIWGLAFLQLPFAYILNFWTSPWITYGAFQLPGFIGTLLVMIGGIKFANILGVKTRFASPLYLLIATIVGLCIFMPIPRIRPEGYYPNDFAFHFSFGLGIVGLVLTVFCAMIFLRIKQGAGNSFANPLAWFFLVNIAHLVAGLQGLFLSYISFPSLYVIISWLYFLPWVIAGLMLLKSSYSFNKAGS